MIDNKKLIEELLDCVADATDSETQITSLTMAGMLMNEVLDEALTTPDVMPRFIINYKNDGFDKELFWETTAKTDVDAVDIFWKTHDVMCEILSVKEV